MATPEQTQMEKIEKALETTIVLINNYLSLDAEVPVDPTTFSPLAAQLDQHYQQSINALGHIRAEKAIQDSKA